MESHLPPSTSPRLSQLFSQFTIIEGLNDVKSSHGSCISYIPLHTSTVCPYSQQMELEETERRRLQLIPTLTNFDDALDAALLIQSLPSRRWWTIPRSQA